MNGTIQEQAHDKTTCKIQKPATCLCTSTMALADSI